MRRRQINRRADWPESHGRADGRYFRLIYCTIVVQAQACVCRVKAYTETSKREVVLGICIGQRPGKLIQGARE